MANKRQQPPPSYTKQQGSPKTAHSNPGTQTPTVASTVAAAVTPQHGTVPPQEDPSTVFTLLPMAPLICRSGRPFDDQAAPDGARFPPPSTVAGCVRTAWAREHKLDFGPELMQLAVTGPILARPGDQGLRWFAPRPADARYFGQGDEALCVRCEPKPFAPGCGADLPDDLLPVQLVDSPDGKETKGPLWWDWEDLRTFREGKEAISHPRLTDNGWSPAQGDRRTHVAIERTTQAPKTGQLFQTEGLDLAPPKWLEDAPTSDFRLLVKTGEPLGPAIVHLGGERRLARIEPRDATAWPTMPGDWVGLIRAKKGLVLTLLTPALFSRGYRPGWLAPEDGGRNPSRLIGAPPGLPGLKLALRAAALGRWQPHSGWDLKKQKPRAGRKLVPAGAVYWFALQGEPSDEDLAALWLMSLCDHEQDRRDGFGLALPAPWQPPANDTATNSPE